SFDVICSFQVLEHVYEVNDFINNQLRILKKGGRLIVGAPNNNPYLFIHDKYHTLNLPPHHAGLWNKKSLTSLEKVFNLEVEEVFYEPFSISYHDFFEVNFKRLKNKRVQRFIRKSEFKYRKIFRQVLSKLFK